MPKETDPEPRLRGAILAGGKSTRFGSDKAGALLAGRPMLQWVADALATLCEEILVVRAAGQVLPNIEGATIRVVDDVFEERGPLAGMVAAFEAAGDGACAVVSCDAPLVQPALVRALHKKLDGHDAICGRARGVLQPLVGVYRAERCLPAFRACVEAGRLSVRAAFEALDVVVVEEEELRAFDPALRSYLGVNTPAELSRVAALIENEAATGG